MGKTFLRLHFTWKSILACEPLFSLEPRRGRPFQAGVAIAAYLCRRSSSSGHLLTPQRRTGIGHSVSLTTIVKSTIATEFCFVLLW